MTERNADLDRAAAALARGISPRPDDHDHPAYETIEALVDGRLHAADAESVQTHVELCSVCAEDVADLSALRTAMEQPAAAATPVPAPAGRRLMVIAASIAATVVLAVWLSDRGPAAPAPAPLATLPPAAPAGPASRLTPEEQVVVTGAAQSGRLEVPADVASLAGSVGTLLGEPGDGGPLKALMPVGTVVLAARPGFAWSAMPGARAYTVAVFDEQFTEVARSSRLTTTAWTPNVDLPPGRTLSWQVTAHLPTGDVNGPAPPQPEARFRVIDAPAAARTMDQLARLTNEPLALGILLARTGLLQEAARLLERAAADETTRAQAQALLADLQRPR